MAAPGDWRTDLSALDRYDSIQKIQASLPDQSMSEAVAIEQAAYNNASTQDEYEALCHRPSAGTQGPDAVAEEPITGIRIGGFTDCTPISEGVTSEVYRSSNKALKVIVAHNIEPHNPQREAKILASLRPPCIPLLEVFHDQHQRLVLVFPFMPNSLEQLLDQGTLSQSQRKAIFRDVLAALHSIHSQGIVHRDIKPSAVLLESPDGPAYLSDFGTAWHPKLSTYTEPATNKILDIGTGPYRAPEVLFGNKAYGPPVDMWGLGVMISEAVRSPPTPIFESRPVQEDGNQLGLILSIFKTLGTPTPETWPEALEFKVAPFELWTVFPQRPWDEILPGVEPDWRDLVAALIRFDSRRLTAEQASLHISNLGELTITDIFSGVILPMLMLS
ncbi:kinase-like domain-containing protein [Stachybotrys elegans]|uniref:cyclin-dependent kinase n=1 Tax=Stachybotrys elegans TaxID=80388 RepID=A0A8K0STV4_9HYPO|nr:kinase-like domain-containing protein [Stachybotrys elegans]